MTQIFLVCLRPGGRRVQTARCCAAWVSDKGPGCGVAQVIAKRQIELLAPLLYACSQVGESETAYAFLEGEDGLARLQQAQVRCAAVFVNLVLF